jgi:hypothetical protein
MKNIFDKKYSLESEYQADLKKYIIELLTPIANEYGYSVDAKKTDPNQTQGIPDLEIHCGPLYAMLEVKISETAPHRPNQDYYVKYYNEQSFARFIFPENQKTVLNELYVYFRTALRLIGGRN